MCYFLVPLKYVFVQVLLCFLYLPSFVPVLVSVLASKCFCVPCIIQFFLICNHSRGNCKFSSHGFFSRAFEVFCLSLFCACTEYIATKPFLDFWTVTCGSGVCNVYAGTGNVQASAKASSFCWPDMGKFKSEPETKHFIGPKEIRNNKGRLYF